MKVATDEHAVRSRTAPALAGGTGEPADSGDVWRVGIERGGSAAQLGYKAVPNRGVEFQWVTNPPGFTPFG